MVRHHEMFNIHRYLIHQNVQYINSYYLFPFRWLKVTSGNSSAGWIQRHVSFSWDFPRVFFGFLFFFLSLEQSQKALLLLWWLLLSRPSNRNPLASCWAWLTLSPPNRLRLFSSSSLSEDKKRSTFLFILYIYILSIILFFFCCTTFVMFARLYPVSNGNNLCIHVFRFSMCNRLEYDR